MMAVRFAQPAESPLPPSPPHPPADGSYTIYERDDEDVSEGQNELPVPGRPPLPRGAITNGAAPI